MPSQPAVPHSNVPVRVPPAAAIATFRDEVRQYRIVRSVLGPGVIEAIAQIAATDRKNIWTSSLTISRHVPSSQASQVVAGIRERQCSQKIVRAAKSLDPDGSKVRTAPWLTEISWTDFARMQSTALMAVEILASSGTASGFPARLPITITAPSSPATTSTRATARILRPRNLDFHERDFKMDTTRWMSNDLRSFARLLRLSQREIPQIAPRCAREIRAQDAIYNKILPILRRNLVFSFIISNLSDRECKKTSVETGYIPKRNPLNSCL